MKRPPLKVFYSYAHEDEPLRDRIDEHLEILRRQNLIVGWHDRHIIPGTEWNRVISDQLLAADIVLLLVSKAFMASTYVNEVEIPEAMKVHNSGKVRVIPILLEEIENLDQVPFAKLQILPTRATPLSTWKDPVKALRDIAIGVRQVAKDIIVKGGGPFEFGPHLFTEAELSSLPKADRERTINGLGRLYDRLTRAIPVRRYESNLLIATWALRQFGKPSPISGHGSEALFYMAQVITSFDLVALQEVDRHLGRLEALMEILGPDWKALVTDVAPGVKGNRERFAFLYYEPRVTFRNFSSQVVLPAERVNGKSVPVKQFARPPLVAAFQSGAMAFQVCTAHIVYGGVGGASMKERLLEINKLGKYLKDRSKYEETDLYLMGDFQMGNIDSPVIDILREHQVEIPEELLHPSNLNQTKYYDLIGFTSRKRQMPLGTNQPCSGVYDLYQDVLREVDFDSYKNSDAFRRYASIGSRQKKATVEQYRRWNTFLISDHLPLWAELTVIEEGS
ncbi:MAG: TIR domain-containing protein [Desulfobacterales bacterium]|jgi:endonuclease/exonuclease/phosphatase family metal-dependent hydrolase